MNSPAKAQVTCHSGGVPGITVTIPADPAYVGLLRYACAHVAATADLTLEQIEDLRIAVSEAATLLIAHSEQLTCTFTPLEHEVKVQCSAMTDEAISIDHDDLAWLLLSSLAEATPIQDHSHVTIELVKARNGQ